MIAGIVVDFFRPVDVELLRLRDLRIDGNTGGGGIWLATCWVGVAAAGEAAAGLDGVDVDTQPSEGVWPPLLWVTDENAEDSLAKAWEAAEAAAWEAAATLDCWAGEGEESEEVEGLSLLGDASLLTNSYRLRQPETRLGREWQFS